MQRAIPDVDPEAVSFRAASESFRGHTTSHVARSADPAARDGLPRAHSEKHRAIADESIAKAAADTADIEREVNELAAEVLIDTATWRRSNAHVSPSAQAIHDFATRMQMSPAVVAGRIRYERPDYSLFLQVCSFRSHRHRSEERGPAPQANPGTAALAAAFKVKGALLVGGDGIAVEGFPSRPVSQWLVN